MRSTSITSLSGILLLLDGLPLVSFYLIERPGLKLKKRFEVRRTGVDALHLASD